jgi:hypothetical protein
MSKIQIIRTIENQNSTYPYTDLFINPVHIVHYEQWEEDPRVVKVKDIFKETHYIKAVDFHEVFTIVKARE